MTAAQGSYTNRTRPRQVGGDHVRLMSLMDPPCGFLIHAGNERMIVNQGIPSVELSHARMLNISSAFLTSSHLS